MSWLVCVNMGHMRQGLDNLVTLDEKGNPRLFATKEEAEEFCKEVWPEYGYVKEYEEDDTSRPA